MNPTEVGNRSEAAILAALVLSGHRVLMPFGDGCRYDLVAEVLPGRFLRIQVKTARLHDQVVSFRTCSQTGGGSQPYGDEVDAFGVHEPVSGRCYLVPAERAPSLGMRLRLAPTRNGQSKGCHWARDYEIGSASSGPARRGR